MTAGASPPVRVVVADDHDILRAGLVATLQASENPPIVVVGEARDGLEALELVSVFAPDVLITDLRMPRLDGLGLVRRLTGALSSPAVLIFTVVEDPSVIGEALDAGADGYLIKTASAVELIDGVRRARAGELVVSAHVGTILARHLRDRGAQQLSAREVEVIDLVAGGNTNAQIARALFVGETTVRTHLRRAFTKLGVRDRASAVAAAVRLGLIDVR